LYPAAAVTCALPGAAGAAGPSGWTVWWNQEDRPEARDPLRQRAGSRAGAMSLLTGVAALKSVRSGRLVTVSSLIRP